MFACACAVLTAEPCSDTPRGARVRRGGSVGVRGTRSEKMDRCVSTPTPTPPLSQRWVDDGAEWTI